MKRNNLTPFIVKIIFTSYLLALAALHLMALGQGTLPPCQTPPYATNPSGTARPLTIQLAASTTVTVIIDQRFSPEQQQAVRDGFNNWLNSGHGVTFSFQVGPVPDTITQPPADTTYVLADPVNRADVTAFVSNGRLGGSYMRLGDCTTPENLVGKTAHETGHQFGLGNCDTCQPGSTIMGPAYQGPNGDTCNAYYPAGMNGPRDCDFNAVLNSGAFDPPPPTPTPTPDCIDNDNDGYGWGSDCLGPDCNDSNPFTTTCGGGGGVGSCGGDCSLRCLEVGAYCDPSCNCYTPVVIDTSGNGFRLTSGRDGVNFDIDGDPGTQNRLGWTEVGSDDAWLTLDRNGNGRIDDGTEMFGDLTPQPISADQNGFLALAEYDRPERGGNGDGTLNVSDTIYLSLRLWADSNHDGVSEAGELHTLPAFGVSGISLDYKESRRRDRHNNVFRYRAKVYGTGGTHLGRWAYDVFLAPPR